MTARQSIGASNRAEGVMAAVRYIVRDVDQAVGFYTSQLGFELEQQMGSAFALVRRDGLAVWLSGPQSSAARPMPDGRHPEPGGWNRLVLEFDDLAGTVTRLRAAGATFRNDVISGPGGMQTLVEDPSGNAIELFQPAR
jgi:catechol 2,3-dioxygenase-like lactoylglutathione lyase family enzyme